MISTILSIIGAIFIIFVIGAYIFINYTGPKVPKETDELIKEILNTPAEQLPELVTGEIGYAKNGNVSIWYERISNESTTKGTVILVNGLSQTCLDWQPYIYKPLMAAGYQVIRFDNRGVGMSDWIKDWKNNKYNLEDMAKDAIAVLDTNGIDKAHVVGMSMGGMIAQRLAISHRARILSLTSVMSTGYFDDKETPNVPTPFIINLYRYMLRYRDLKKIENRMKLHLGVQRILMGKGGYDFDNKAILQKAHYELTKRNGYNIESQTQHGYAVKKSGSRYDELKQLDIPTLVVHGTTDPLVTFEHGQKYAPMIPNARTLFIEGMGHDFPRVHTPAITKAIIENFELVISD